MNIPRTTGLVLVGLGIAGMGVGLLLPWARSGGLHADGATIAGIFLLGPLLSLARLTFGHFAQRAPSAAAGIAALTAAVVAWASARQVEPSAGVGVGGPLTIAGAVTAALGWLLVVLAVQLSPRLPRPGLVVVTAVVLPIVLDITGIYWAVEGRFVDTTTAAAAPTPKDDPKLGTDRWQAAAQGTGLIGVAGGQLLVRDASGVRGYAAQTGKPTWHYLRSDVTALAAGIVGGAVVTTYGTGEGILVVAHETATGSERFSRRYTTKDWRPKTVVSTLDGHTAVLVGSGPDAGDVAALNVDTGDVRWTWRPQRDGGPCDITGAAPGERVVGLALRCRAKGVDDVAIGLSTADGREQWAWHPSYTSEIPRGEELAIRAVPDWQPPQGEPAGFLVQYGLAPRHAMFLAAENGATGTGLGPERTGAGTLGTVVDATAVYFLGTTDGAEITAVDARIGTSAWRTQLPWLIGWHLVGTGATHTRAYLLLSTSQPETASGPLRVVALDKDSGKVVGDRALSCAISCMETAIAADTRSVVVASREPKANALTLVALA